MTQYTYFIYGEYKTVEALRADRVLKEEDIGEKQGCSLVGSDTVALLFKR